MPRSPRAALRRRVLATLAHVRRDLAAQKNRWDVTGTVYVPNPTDPNAMGTWEDRPADQYPENRMADIGSLIMALDEAYGQLGELRRELAAEYFAQAANPPSPTA